MIWRMVAVFGILLSSAFAQTGRQIQADCGPFGFTTTTIGSPIIIGPSYHKQTFPIQSGTQCVVWVVSYSSTGFTGETVTFQSAPDTSFGLPGTWATFAGTVVSGSNPSTSTTSALTTFSGYFPWVRVNVSGLTGTGKITGVVYGYLH